MVAQERRQAPRIGAQARSRLPQALHEEWAPRLVGQVSADCFGRNFGSSSCLGLLGLEGPKKALKPQAGTGLISSAQKQRGSLVTRVWLSPFVSFPR